jgi:hypothetical protein
MTSMAEHLVDFIARATISRNQADQHEVVCIRQSKPLVVLANAAVDLVVGSRQQIVEKIVAKGVG